VAEFEFTQQDMANAMKGFDQCSAALDANMKTLDQQYRQAIGGGGQGLAGKNVGMLIQLYENGIQPTCARISQTMAQMGADITMSQGQYNENYDAASAKSLQSLLGRVDGGATASPSAQPSGPLSQMLNT
jgi:hypothetical protein